VTLATFSPAGKRVLTMCKDNSARLWNAGGRELAELKDVETARFNSDGSRVVTT
jgi:WD40 repeat protein